MDQERLDESTIPNEFLCPIFQQVMRDPVTTVDGFTFERRAITQWFDKGRETNPLTNETLSSIDLISNRALRQVIQHHQERVREIERQANLNAEAIIKGANQSLAQILPMLINEVGMIDLDKITILAEENTRLRFVLKAIITKYEDLKKVFEGNTLTCNQCRRMITSSKLLQDLIEGEHSQIIKQKSVLGDAQINLTADSLSYLIMNIETVKKIDFKRMKKGQWTKYQIKGVMLHKSTVQEIIKRIRRERKIPETDFVRVWIASISANDLYAHISNESAIITGPYTRKIKPIGKMVDDTRKKIQELKIQPMDYFIVEHGQGDEYVFREEEAKCGYCYRVLKLNKFCDCGRAMYCSDACKSKDQPFHDKVCRLKNN